MSHHNHIAAPWHALTQAFHHYIYWHMQYTCVCMYQRKAKSHKRCQLNVATRSSICFARFPHFHFPHNLTPRVKCVVWDEFQVREFCAVLLSQHCTADKVHVYSQKTTWKCHWEPLWKAQQELTSKLHSYLLQYIVRRVRDWERSICM